MKSLFIISCQRVLWKQHCWSSICILLTRTGIEYHSWVSTSKCILSYKQLLPVYSSMHPTDHLEGSWCASQSSRCWQTSGGRVSGTFPNEGAGCSGGDWQGPESMKGKPFQPQVNVVGKTNKLAKWQGLGFRNLTRATGHKDVRWWEMYLLRINIPHKEETNKCVKQTNK